MTNDPNEDRKIIIDEDWKSQVEQEKSQVEQEREQLKHGEKPAEPSGADAGPAGTGAGPEQIPEASFALLVTTLATQAMAAMGQIPDPSQDKPLVHMGLARHYIDTLTMLEEKTKGNLDQEEASMLEQVLHQLRLLFVDVQQAPGGAP